MAISTVFARARRRLAFGFGAQPAGPILPVGWTRSAILIGTLTMSLGLIDPGWAQEPRGGTSFAVARAATPGGQPVAVPTAQRGLDDRLIVTGAAVLVLETLLIVWLLDEHRRRRRAEDENRRGLEEAHTQLLTITHLDRRAAMGEATSAITHQLNQPLEAILHNAEAGELMLESGRASSEDLHRIFADIRRIDLRAAQIIGRLRDLLRRHEFETRLVDLNELATDTVAVVAPVASANNLEIHLDLSEGPVCAVGDSIHLQQVLLNVLLNGIEAMAATPHEARRLVLRTAQVADQVEVSVTDRGPGIRADGLARIFEPFYTTKDQGMGVGLSIGKTIIEAHGGRIQARNNDGAGATVSFTIPRCVETAAKADTRAESRTLVFQASLAGGSGRVPATVPADTRPH